MTFQKFPKPHQFQLRTDDLFKIRLEQLAAKSKMSASEYIRKLVNEDYKHYREK